MGRQQAKVTWGEQTGYSSEVECRTRNAEVAVAESATLTKHLTAPLSLMVEDLFRNQDVWVRFLQGAPNK